MWVYDAETLAFLAVNDEAVAHYGYTRDEFLGMTIKDIRPRDDVPELLAYLGDRPASAARLWRHVKKDGTVIDVAVTTHGVTWAGRPATVVSVDDVSERREAEERLRLLSAAVQAAENGIMIADRGGRILWVNRGFTRLTGFAGDDVIGQTPRLLRSGHHSAAEYEALWKTIVAGDVWHGVLVNRRKDGTVYDEEQTITPLTDGQGRITHFIAIKQDVTDRRRADAARQRAAAHFRALSDNALDMVAVVNADGTFRYVSPSTERTLGYGSGELLGTRAVDLVHPDDRDRLIQALAGEGRADDHVRSVECRVRHRDGTWRICETNARKLMDDPALAGVILNSRDVTERRRAAELQGRLREQLAQSEKLAAMGELLAGVAHELNNPLAAVLGYADLLAASATDPVVLARATKLRSASERCARIVKNFLSLARQGSVDWAPVDVARLVRDTVELLAYPLRVDSIDLTLAIADEVPIVNGDRHQLQQVLVNLITNAHHALRGMPEPRQLTIAVAADAGDSKVTISVTDTGPGIPADIEARIFEPFFTTKPVGEGTGLGLPICRGIVHAHGGTLHLDRPDGGGARFRVELPAGTENAAGPVTPVEPMPACTPRSIVVVDDEPAVAALIAEVLTDAGHHVDVVADGRSALDRIAGGTCDAILSDVKMPDMDGIALYHAVAERRPELLPRFGFVSGDVVNPHTAHFIEATAAPFLRKPFTVDDLGRFLYRLVGQNGNATVHRTGPATDTDAR